MNDFWNELRRLVKCAEKASSGNSAEDYNAAYFALRKHMNNHAPPDSADAEIAQLRADAERYRKLRSMHWSNGDDLTVTRGRSVKLGFLTYSGDQLDAAIDAARGGE